MNDENTYNFQPLEIREGYRKDGALFAKCSECNDHISKMRDNQRWMHSLILEQSFHADGSILSTKSRQVDYCPIVLLKEEGVKIVSKLTDAYKLVIEDIAQDIGYVKGAKETAISVLSGRLTELVEVWQHEETDSETSAV
jgi:hypothetical protein